MFIRQLIASRFTYAAIRIAGYVFLIAYLVFVGDWRISAVWVLAYCVISFSIAWLFPRVKLLNRFPQLHRYLLYPPNNIGTEKHLSDNEWSLAKAKYAESAFRGNAILFTPAEDGLICVPVLLVGVSAISAAFGGIFFGILHLGRFTFFECLSKTIYYILVCYFVLPNGLLNIVVGHLVINALSFALLKLAIHNLSKESQI